ncbi:hypothetical protein [Paenibacillus sp. Marseille-Q4541]|uniref:hypothetical protein n=1 Tax=Paenibacillus sp. Marseille-Q4541 TaxID=2831522 RepID=UPI001BA808A4|nr:hypothetical protein [Paenibacillus sp. Marseille-Q4541]
MNVKLARQLASDWVKETAQQIEGFYGAYFSGSTITLSEDAELPPASDIDIVVVVEEEPSMKLGKFTYQGVLLEVTYLSMEQINEVEKVLCSYHLAGGFRYNSIILDKTGHLQNLYEQISTQYAQRKWVLCRCQEAYQKIINGIKHLDTSAPMHDLAPSLVFPIGITTHVLLVAALWNPTVRLRYLKTRQMLTEYNQLDLYEELLELLGSTHLTPQRVEHHLTELEKVFDAAVKVSSTPYFFSSDITEEARHIAIDGSRELIHSGNHQEAVFWIVATFARCHKIMASDALEEDKKKYEPAFHDLMSDLGLTTSQDYELRSQQLLEFLPGLWNAALQIIDDNKEVI